MQAQLRETLLPPWHGESLPGCRGAAGFRAVPLSSSMTTNMKLDRARARACWMNWWLGERKARFAGAIVARQRSQMNGGDRWALDIAHAPRRSRRRCAFTGCCDVQDHLPMLVAFVLFFALAAVNSRWPWRELAPLPRRAVEGQRLGGLHPRRGEGGYGDAPEGDGG